LALARALQGVEVACLVFGALADKAWPEMLDAVSPLARDRVYVAPPVFSGLARASTDPAIFSARHVGRVETDVPAALAAARRMAGSGLVVVCGSIFLVGEARGILLDLPRDPPIAL
jgi:folylpolyglutamate synthase/dihydropteroate synthase